MDEAIVFEKTERGLREIAQPGGELQPRLRRVLIMIDGRRVVGDIAPMTRPGEIEAIVEALLRGGYIVASGESAASPAQGAGEATGQAAGPAGFEQSRQRAARVVEEMLGPQGEPLAIEIERCGTPLELRELISKAQRIIGQFLGQARAEEFRKKTAAEK